MSILKLVCIIVYSLVFGKTQRKKKSYVLNRVPELF